MVQRRSDEKPLGRVQVLALAAAVNRGDETVTMLRTGERRLVAAVFDEHQREIDALARDGSAAAARLLAEFAAGSAG